MIKKYNSFVVLAALVSIQNFAFAGPNDPVTYTVKDVTSEYKQSGDMQAPPPETDPTPSAPTTNGTRTGITLPQINLDQIVTLGNKIWNFVVNNKPTAVYNSIKSSVVPEGVTNWTRLRGWARPVSKVYRVEFKNILGGNAGSFDYRISYLYGGGLNGQGKFLGQISFNPVNIKLHTDRSLNVQAQLSDPLNFGTESDPVAAVQLLVSWTSPTTTRYQMNSAEYFIYGTGEIEDLTNGN